MLLVSLAVLAAQPASAVQRVAVLIGAKNGWAEDPPLRYSVEDAQKLADTLVELGDFSREDIELLSDPTAEQVRWALDRAAARTAGAAEQSLFVFYYSGHADPTHLHLSGAPLSLEELYRRLQALPPALKLGILDACQSGAILPKGGRPTRSFQLELKEELALRGLVFLTSSGADELSQEARAVAGSIFSNHLVSGLRGPADDNEDARVTLEEAYRHAYASTLRDTTASPLGLQRPRVSIQLRGQGELVLTRLTGGSHVVFPRSAKTCFVTDGAERRLLAEVPASPQRETRLGLPPGDYVLKCSAGGQYEVARFVLTAGTALHLSSLSFREVPFSKRVVAKGEGGGVELGSLKRRGFVMLAQGRAEEALQLFEQALQEDRRDQETFLGKARALLRMAEAAERSGRPWVARRLRMAAVMAYPRIEQELHAVQAGPEPVGGER
jgi:tetratricopeptide (TPR) repeat protein